MHVHVLDNNFKKYRNFERSFRKNSQANVILKFGIPFTQMDLDSPLYLKTLTRNDGSGFEIVYCHLFHHTEVKS